MGQCWWAKLDTSDAGWKQGAYFDHQKSEICKLLTCPTRLLRAASFLLSVYCTHPSHLCRAFPWELSAVHQACGPGPFRHTAGKGWQCCPGISRS